GTASQNIKKFSSLARTGFQVVKKHLVGQVILDTKPTNNSEPFEFENEMRAELPQGLLMVSIRTTQRKGYCESKHQEVFKFGWDRTLSVGQVILDTKPTDNGEPFEFENELRAELPQGPLMVSIRTTQSVSLKNALDAMRRYQGEEDRGTASQNIKKFSSFAGTGLQVVKHLVGEVTLDTKPSDNGEPFEFENELRAELPQGPVIVSIRMTQRLANLTSDKICTMAPISPDRGDRGVGKGGGRQRAE
ncbi:von Willebrand factor A domain-containing protein, partial [Striga asiatica]